MRVSRTSLDGRRGWSAVAGLATVLAILVAGQLPAAADGSPLAPVGAVVDALVPSLAPSAAAPAPAPVKRATTSVAKTAVAPSAAPVPPADVTRAVVKPAARPAVVQPAVEPAAKPAAAKAAASLCAGDGWQQRRGRAALASLQPGALERTGFRVDFLGARRGYMGLTHLESRRIEMFVRACGTQSDELLRHVMAHELGHAYDTTKMTDAARRTYQTARGIPSSTPWYGCSGCTDFATPAGDFAEVYAQWARGASSNRSQLAGDVPAGQLAQLARQFFGA